MTERPHPPPPPPQPNPAAQPGDLAWPARWARRWAFWGYVCVLLVGTHWPRLELNVPGVERPDLIIHFTAFGAWTVLFWAAGLGGAPLRWRSLCWVFPACVLYAGLDESTQGLPGIHRTVAWDDFLANCGGVTLGTLFASAVIVATRWWAPAPTLGRPTSRE